MSVDAVTETFPSSSSSCRYQKKSKGKKGEKNQKDNSRRDEGGECFIYMHVDMLCVYIQYIHIYTCVGVSDCGFPPLTVLSLVMFSHFLFSEPKNLSEDKMSLWSILFFTL